MFDFLLHDAGNFDAITNLWVHVVLAVRADRLTTFDDGLPVLDSSYGFYTGGGVMEASNVAYPNPGSLTRSLGRLPWLIRSTWARVPTGMPSVISSAAWRV